MTRKLRVLIGVVTIELLMGGLWFYLAQLRAMQPDEGSIEAQTTIGSTMGMAMGAFLGFGVLMMFVAAKNDRASNRAKQVIGKELVDPTGPDTSVEDRS